MFSPLKSTFLSVCCIGVAFLLSGCGERGVELARNNPDREGAELFAQNCAGCHTLSVAGTEGSGTSIKYQFRYEGPNLDQRNESVDSVLYALANGGFSGEIMPSNILTGPEAQEVARFVAKYAGSKAKVPPSPTPQLP